MNTPAKTTEEHHGHRYFAWALTPDGRFRFWVDRPTLRAELRVEGDLHLTDQRRYPGDPPSRRGLQGVADRLAWSPQSPVVKLPEKEWRHQRAYPGRLTEYGPDVRELLIAGATIPATAYVEAQRVQGIVIAQTRLRHRPYSSPAHRRGGSCAGRRVAACPGAAQPFDAPFQPHRLAGGFGAGRLDTDRATHRRAARRRPW